MKGIGASGKIENEVTRKRKLGIKWGEEGKKEW
jgi:hypothetical protein